MQFVDGFWPADLEGQGERCAYILSPIQLSYMVPTYRDGNPITSRAEILTYNVATANVWWWRFLSHTVVIANTWSTLYRGVNAMCGCG